MVINGHGMGLAAQEDVLEAYGFVVASSAKDGAIVGNVDNGFNAYQTE